MLTPKFNHTSFYSKIVFEKRNAIKCIVFFISIVFVFLSAKTRERGSLANILPEEPREKGRFKREVIHVDHADPRV